MGNPGTRVEEGEWCAWTPYRGVLLSTQPMPRDAVSSLQTGGVRMWRQSAPMKPGHFLPLGPGAMPYRAAAGERAVYVTPH